MAENNKAPISVNTFHKGMIKDLNESFIGDGQYTHARNAVNNSAEGQIGIIGNEPANLSCIDLPYTFIGSIPMSEDKWIVFTTNDTQSEIGIFDESQCSYNKVVNDPCLGFKRSHLITGVYRKKFDCSGLAYFADGLNPDRVLNLDKIPYKEKNTTSSAACATPEYTTELDCEKIRLAPLLSIPNLELTKGKGSGTLLNGSYQLAVAYCINETKITDYLVLSNIQPLFDHNNGVGSLELKLDNLDTEFDEFELVIISTINQQTVAKKLGLYSTHQTVIYIDTIDPSLTTVSLNLIPLRTPAIEKSDAMYEVNSYLIRTGIYTKPDFDYQRQANNIKTEWVAVKYPSSYYKKGGNKAGYMRDEQYPFFIRWVYNTGDKSVSSHIPGREALTSDLSFVTNNDAIELENNIIPKQWQVYNTASITSTNNTTLADGGVVISKGEMGYWESTELYPDNNTTMWGSLCGKPIRHHKFPDNNLVPHFTDNGESIVVLGVQFNNITPPLDANNKVIPSIVGYEILRGSREGQKTVIAKGIINNMREYEVTGNSSVKGLFQNYPYNDLRPDKYLTTNEDLSKKGPGDGGENNNNPLSRYRKDVFSFHSPETTFNKPYLNANEIKIYQEFTGTSTGKFEVPYKHPRHKLATKFTDVISKVIGVVKTVGDIVGALAGADGNIGLQGTSDLPFTQNLLANHRPEMIAGSWVGLTSGFLNSVGAPGIGGVAAGKRQIANTAITVYNVAMVASLSVITTEATAEQLFKVIYGLIPVRQFGLQYNSHGYYNTAVAKSTAGNHRRAIVNSGYIDNNLQSFSGKYRVNNLYRSKYVVFELNKEIADPVTIDNSRFRMSGDGVSANINDTVSSTISTQYAALKSNFPSQYGQLEGIKQLPVGSGIDTITNIKNVKHNSSILFGGDVYINRFTEKNSMFFFNDWLVNQPDQYEYDYRNYINIPYPRHWVNFEIGNYSLFGGNTTVNRHLNKRESSTFYVKSGYFYLFCNGVRDFFVESEINLALRDWDDEEGKYFYDPEKYTDLSTMFRSDLIKKNNYYKYDYSLSNSRLFNSYLSWGSLLPRDFDVTVADKCYSYYPHRIIYSLPQTQELKKDNWRVFLVNNYKNMVSGITAIKPINRTGAIILMKDKSPVVFTGVDELQTDTGIKITLGDGGLFARDFQQIVNADDAYQFGSCQDRYSIVNTPMGTFWISADQGKIFQFAGGIKEISKINMKWWLSEYLPSQLLQQFPDFKEVNNPVAGIGCQSVYDNTNELIYFTKKDYRAKDGVLYNPDLGFYIKLDSGANSLNVKIDLGSPDYFEDASWTLSYDPKKENWVSYHDWHPSFVLPGKNHFMSVNGDSVWKHNIRKDLFCNFYGVDYPFEVEFVHATGQNITTLHSIEYQMEAYTYKNFGRDKFHVLDYNFDRAIIYNSEQISGLLKMELKPKNNPVALLNYPKINASDIQVHYSKEENKYRVNQFWDISKDRGEFTGAQFPLIVTKPNGYEFNVNPKAVNYFKNPTEHKKFRHYFTKIHLKKNVSGDVKILFKLSNSKIQPSSR